MQAGDLFDARYELVARAGSGGMGTVWRARDRTSGYTVAVKILREPEGDGALRFRKEAQILASLEHPHIVRYVASAIAHTGEPYLVMEWLDGESLMQRMERKPLSVDEAARLVRHVSSALAIAHERGITHRDIKPSNLLLVDGEVDRIKLLDFGIARVADAAATGVTRTGSILGTPGYMAPEQARGEREAGAAADVFALGCVLFECLAGKPAFQGAHPMALLAKLLLEEPPRLSDIRADIPLSLVELCHKMLAKKAEERFGDGRAVLLAIEDYETNAPKDKPRHSDYPRSVITATERRLISIVAVEPTKRMDASVGIKGELVAAVSRLAAPLGAHVEELASGVVIAVLLGEGSVLDQAANAARCASWAKIAARTSRVALVMGRGESTNRLPVGEALERVASLLDDTTGEGIDGDPVRIDEMTYTLIEQRFDVVGRDGKYFLRGERKATPEMRTLLGKPSPFVGRERELRNIVDLCADSFEEERAVACLVTAPSGTGKSRLRQEVIRSIRERYPNLALTMAQPDAIGAGSAYALLSGAIRVSLAISAGEPLETQRRKIELLAATYHEKADQGWIAEFLGELAGIPFPDETSPLLRAARQSPQLMADRIEMAFVRISAAIAAKRPILLLLEDLHWGDAPSLKVVDALLRDLSDCPVAVLAFARPEVHELFPRLFAGRGMEEVRLKPLARRAATELVASMLGGVLTSEDASRLVERAEGNAFYLEELIRAVADGRRDTLPETVLGMVESRLSALAPEARRVLRAASIFGEVFWAQGVLELVGGMASFQETIAELVARELIVAHEQSRFSGQKEYAFRHAMIREGAYATLPDEDRMRGHRLAGEWLEQAGELDPLVLGEHYQRGGDLAWAGAFFLKAGNQSFERDDLPGALSCAQRGIDCGDFAALTGNLHTLLASVYCWKSELGSAHAVAMRALPLVEKGTRWECMLLFHGAWASLVLGAEEDFQQIARRFIAFEPVEPLATKEYLLWAPLGASLFTTYGRKELCSALLDRAEAFAECVPRLDLSFVGALAIGRSDQVRAFDRAPGRQLALTMQAVEAFEQIGDTRNQITALNRLGQALGEIGDWEAGEEALRRAVALARQIRGPFVSNQAALHLAALLASTDDSAKWREAEEIACAVLATSGVSHGYRGWAHGIQAQIHLRRGSASEAFLQAQCALPLCERVPLRRAWIHALAVEALLEGKKAESALDLARALSAELIELGGGGYVEVLALVAIVRAFERVGQLSESRGFLRALLRSIQIRLEGMEDGAARERYQKRVPEVVAAHELARRLL